MSFVTQNEITKNHKENASAEAFDGWKGIERPCVSFLPTALDSRTAEKGLSGAEYAVPFLLFVQDCHEVTLLKKTVR